MARAVRFLLLDGPGSVDGLRGILVTRHSSLLVNLTVEEATEDWPNLTEAWQKRHFTSVQLRSDSDGLESFSSQIAANDWSVRLFPDERRPALATAIAESSQVVVGISSGGQIDEPGPGRRALLLDASWTHIASFPDREEVRACLAAALSDVSAERVLYISDLEWDVRLFESVAHDLQEEAKAIPVRVRGSVGRKLWQARQAASNVGPKDTVLLGLVPGRDDRGSFQRLRSDFAQRTSTVRSFPTSPLSTGPGLSRDEALEAVGLWLPTQVLVAAGPISEQVLLARHLEDATRGSPVTVGIAGGEYRVPDFELLRRTEIASKGMRAGRIRSASLRSGLVVVAVDRDGESVKLSGTGLAETVAAAVGRIKINRRGKTPEQIVRDVEMAFSSRGLPVPAVRYLG